MGRESLNENITNWWQTVRLCSAVMNAFLLVNSIILILSTVDTKCVFDVVTSWFWIFQFFFLSRVCFRNIGQYFAKFLSTASSSPSAKSNKYAYVSYNVWDNVQCAYAMRFHGNIFITLSISEKKTDVVFNKRDDNVRRALGH